MIKIHIDFETRSKISVRDVGPWRYSTDPSTDILCLCYKIEGVHEGIITRAMLEDIKDYGAPMTNLEDYRLLKMYINTLNTDFRLVAHNSMFEFCIWNNILAPRYYFKKVTNLNFWECTASKAAALALPRSLADCADALHLSERKDETGKRIMMKMSRPRKPTAKDPSVWYESADDFKTLYKYCKQDVTVESALDVILPPLNTTERKIWELDQKINSRGVKIDLDAVDYALNYANIYKNELNNELCRLTDGAVEKATEVQKLIKYVRQFASEEELPSLAAADIREYLKDCTDSHVKRCLEIRQLAGKSSTSKLEKIKSCVCSDGRVRDILVYHGASTGRWAGAGIQVQNFPRGKEEYDVNKIISALKLGDYNAFAFLYPNVLEAISSALRGLIMSSEGYDLIAADYNAIEARVLFWLAGCQKGLNAFINGTDIYCELASEIFKRKITKKDKEERMLGKSGVLGCGYQMGAERFVSQVKTTTGIDISKETAKLIVDTYRTTYPEIVAFWYNQERAVIQAVKERGTTIYVDKVSWNYPLDSNFLYCTLPSGRKIAYAYPEIRYIKTKWGDMKEQLTFMGVNSLNKKWCRQHSYGGALVENIVQATARDLMVNGMLNLEQAGYKILMTVHDEVVATVPKDSGSVKEYESILATVPTWAKDCPVKAEGWRGERYRK